VGLGPNRASPLLNPLIDRAASIAASVSDDLADSPPDSWTDILSAASLQHGVDFTLFYNTGEQVAGTPITLPPQILTLVKRDGAGPDGGARGAPNDPRRPDRRGPNDPPNFRGENDNPDFRNDQEFRLPGSPDQGDTRPRSPSERRPPPRGRVFFLSDGEPPRLFLGMRTPISRELGRQPRPGTMIVSAPSLLTMGLFMGAQWYLLAALGLMLASALFWWPFVAGLTRTISRLTKVTEHISRGDFSARAPAASNDELGRLGHAVNRMSERLEQFVQGQKRFVGDVAHELCSPLSRLQFALGILEEQVHAASTAAATAPESPDSLADIRDEVQQLSDLVQELLMFSKAAVRGPGNLPLSPVPIADLIHRVIAREHADSAVTVNVPDDMHALAEPGLLARAMANLIRNSCRYAAHAGPITISAAKAGTNAILITISDRGPGVPVEALSNLGDPFFRAELSRSRETGGTGLGLAIVKTCIEACRGTVRFRNLEPTGFEAQIELGRAG